MTAPTPQQIVNSGLRLDQTAASIALSLGHSALLVEAVDLLAAVTAERDQARQMLADAPHSYTIDSEARMVFCPTLTGGTICRCWKAGL